MLRDTTYKALLRLPFRIGGVIGTVAGLVASLWPDKVRNVIGGSEMTIQIIGPWLLVFAVAYFGLLWILKPTSASSPGAVNVLGPNATIHFHHYADQIEPELAALNPASVKGGASPSLVVAEPSAATPQMPLAPIEGQLSVVEQGDTLAATSRIFTPTVRAISPLYVGQIIVSAAQLVDGSIEIAVRAFNGTREIIELDSVHGAILGGINNATGIPLPTPTLRPDHIVAPIPPGTEFMVVLDQPLPSALAEKYSDALNAGDYIALDLRELRVMMRAADHANVAAPLPLWHGASIRRRDDVFTNRIIMVSVGVAVETPVSLTPGTAGATLNSQ